MFLLVFLVCRCMEVTPLIYMKNRKIHEEKDGPPVTLDEVIKIIDKDEKIYVLDIDGIEKNKPNLCTYQTIPGRFQIWVDTGPRNLGDVVDAIMAGATDITLRKNLWHDLDIPSIREITESGIYADIDFENQREHNIYQGLFYDADGLVIFNDKNQIESDFKAGSIMKNYCAKYKVYVYEQNPENLAYWKNLGASGLLIDLGKKKEFTENGF